MDIEKRREYQRLYCQRHRAENRERYREASHRWIHRRDKPCPLCGKPMIYRSKRCHACYLQEMKERSLETATSWKGVFTNVKGRVLLYIPSHPDSRKEGYILRSRLVMEKEVGRRLKPDEIVHHLNGVKGDDHPKNLALVSKHSHSTHTLEKLFQKRIRELEAELAQHFLPF